MAKRFSKQKWSIHACNIHLGRLSSLSVLLHVVAPLPRFSSSPRNTLGLLFLSSGAHIAWKRLDNAEGTRYIHIYIYTGRRVSKAIINERGTITRVSSQLFLRWRETDHQTRLNYSCWPFPRPVSTNDEFFNEVTRFACKFI